MKLVKCMYPAAFGVKYSTFKTGNTPRLRAAGAPTQSFLRLK
jgi:hypothetical protein